MANGDADRRNSGGGMVLAFVGVLVFSFTMPMTKIAVRSIDPMLAAMGRAAIASVLAMVVLAATRSRRPTRRQVRQLLAVSGGVVFGFPLLSAYAMHHTDSSHGAVVNGLLPLATAGLAVIRLGERPSRLYWACSVVGLVAVVAFVVVEGGGRVHVADLLLIAAVIAAGIGYTEGARLAREIGGWQVICWALVIAAPAVWAISVVSAVTDGLHATGGQWAAFGYTAVFSMFLGFFAWYTGLARAGVSRGSQLQLTQPAMSILWGWPMLGESLSAAAVVTIVVVLGAVAVGRRSVVR